MFKLTIIFRNPPNIPEFEKKWAKQFVPFAEKMPGILRIEVSNIVGEPTGASEYYKLHEFYFATREAMDKAMHSDMGNRAGQALQVIAPNIATLLFADVMEDIVREQGKPPEPPPQGS